MRTSKLENALILFGLLLLTSTPPPSHASPSHSESLGAPSASRAKDEPAARAEARQSKRWLRASPYASIRARVSARSAATSPLALDIANAPDWKTPEAVESGFRAVRDHHFFEETATTGLLRRLTWLYPDDGCFARAALGGQLLEKMGRLRPAKLFVFGDLWVDTAYHPRGGVSWWYHVVPAVRAGDTLYALDPAIEPARPLPWREWLARMSPSPDTLEVSLCQSNTYMPFDSCRAPRVSEESQAPADERHYLRLEWNRVRALGHDPARVLGDSPPWR